MMAIFLGNWVENSGKGNPETGFKSPPSRGENSPRAIATLLIDFRCKPDILGRSLSGDENPNRKARRETVPRFIELNCLAPGRLACRRDH